jgi:cation:H+ antiporter
MAVLSLPALLRIWPVPALLFLAALGVVLRAAARFTLYLEALGDHWKLSAELLSFVSALGANIPNYVASLAAFASGQGSVGLGIIVGSNIYNLAVILGLVAVARPERRGITFTTPAMRDVRWVARLAAALGVTTLLTFLALPPRARSVPPAAVPALSVLTLGIFLGLAVHAVQRVSPLLSQPPAVSTPATRETAAMLSTPAAWSARDRRLRHPRRPRGLAVGRVLLALAITLFGVIVMVVAAQTTATDVHLSPVILSLVVLAVATSLPNTVVAYELARTERASTAVEEIVSSNAINLALGSALPLLVWHKGLSTSPLLRLDMALLCLLGVVVLAQVQVRRIPRPVGVSLLGLYVLWVLIHMVT